MAQPHAIMYQNPVISNQGMNALAFGSTNFVFSSLTDHGAEERKRQDLTLQNLKGQEMNGTEIK